ncbi:Protein LAP4 [Harpegnathos saltator]|uniref:Protein LAP4 n=2 Tax=Harpegnathos saltator TaxID=610380 RepID=E2BMS2_HARSA|nr:Protein LAP4 [Harpegnathos saltator]
MQTLPSPTKKKSLSKRSITFADLPPTLKESSNNAYPSHVESASPTNERQIRPLQDTLTSPPSQIMFCEKPAHARFRLPPTPLTAPECSGNIDTKASFSKRQIARSVDGKFQVEQSPTSSPTPPLTKMSVSDKKRLFESAMEEHLKPSPKPDKIFSFLSQDEVEKMKQEEEKKIATLTRDELKSWAQLDENEGLEDLDPMDDNGRPNSRLSSRTSIPLIQNVPSSVRTAKAERRLKERLIQEGLISDEDEEHFLSPAEQRALRAEKRAAWRQARLKSLEQDALQAQMVIKKMSEIMDTNKQEDTRDSAEAINTAADPVHEQEKPIEFATLRPSSADFPKLAVRSKVGPPKEIRESEKVVDEKVTRRTEEYLDEVTGERRVRTVEYVEKLIERQVETLREKIISLELSNAEDDMESITGTGVSDAESESEDIAGNNAAMSGVEDKTDSPNTADASETASSKTNANITVASTKRKKRKRSKKGRH